MEIRQAKVEDAKGIATVHVKTWQTAYKGLMPDELLDGLSIEARTNRWLEKLSDLNNLEVWVAEDNNEIVGFCSVGLSRDDDANSDIGELYAIYIDLDHSDKGLGSKLMKNGLEILRKEGYKKATLWVLDSNVRSKAFYEHKGWIKDGATKDEQRDGFDLKEVRYTINL